MHDADGFERARSLPTIVLFVLATLSAVACTPTPAMQQDTVQQDATDPDAQLMSAIAPIVNGREASDRPWACFVAFHQSDGDHICTGSLVAPNVVLTAGHCLEGATQWKVNCPYSADRSVVYASVSSMAPSYLTSIVRLIRYQNGSDDAGSDLGLLRLDRPLTETHVARVTFHAPSTAGRVRAYGRVNGRNTNRIYSSEVLDITDIDSRWSRWEALRDRVTQPGDSGGPVLNDDDDTVIAVNSAASTTCSRNTPCSYFAMLAPERTWYQSTVQMYVNNLIVVRNPMGCESALNCADCTALASCGWCNGACITGTVDGGGFCSRRDFSWVWTADQCAPTENLDLTDTSSVACDSATTCAACTEMAGCGWCDGACVSGDENGGGTCTATAGTWGWLSTQCASEPAPSVDPCASATDCAACTSMATCGWCNGACITGTGDGGGTCTATAGDWGWLSSQCPDATPAMDACSAATDCAACTALSGCGWCDGVCATGDYSGATGATCSAWAWYSFQCP